MKPLILLLLLFPLAAACADGPSTSGLDAEVERLCAIDGGIKVYEAAMLPPEMFNKYGQINFRHPAQGENALGTEYVYKWDIYYYQNGEPTLNEPQEVAIRRDHIRIIRKYDVKLMGELVMYYRPGDELPGSWISSSYHCPDKLKANPTMLLNKIFTNSIKGNRDEHAN